jgi:hypothetical protein
LCDNVVWDAHGWNYTGRNHSEKQNLLRFEQEICFDSIY